jgi:hypothetical protein
MGLPLGAAPEPPLARASLALTPIDAAAVGSRFVQWLEAPRRDPFEVYRAALTGPPGPSAAKLLSLKAIWRQAGGQLAVINSAVLAEGDEIAGFKLERIEADAVWVRGTNGSERVEFSLVTTAANPSAQAR